MRFLKIVGWLILGLIGLVVLRAVLEPPADYFEIRRVDFAVRGDGASLEIVNTGHSPITIQAVNINQRADCRVGFLMPVNGTFPYALQVGDKISTYGSCRVIRAEIVTNKGLVVYSFANGE
ncbi:hypothetical protein L6654_41715 [Bradyrhizobium sp. WYCCWR 13023]|uniref:Uncharacterized protein n=1 Tax=Bradyrhizobium zhengyangense TaxID=2911009 RepID=A0A9X1RJ98_9BRAD|nr:hypothetical protein [Bradyrhizobium zhengyangense]MCG2633071.1 hypothetical protein [Bradyrhizobium zhengyangense]MCG2668337.1 hypothetical protein [Bradyrhizobium zhengyangense]